MPYRHGLGRRMSCVFPAKPDRAVDRLEQTKVAPPVLAPFPGSSGFHPQRPRIRGSRASRRPSPM